MRLHSLKLQRYSIPFTFGGIRSGYLVCATDEAGRQGEGEIAPLPKFSFENLNQCLRQFYEQKQAILDRDWDLLTLYQQLAELELYPSVCFGIESALLSLLDPIVHTEVETAALLMGTPEEILHSAQLREAEGFTLAKLKVGHLSTVEAKFLIDQLSSRFKLRIDVNRAWQEQQSVQFFSQYSPDTFEYIEEPFSDPLRLKNFRYPLAVDESFPGDLSFEDLECFPTLKVLVYKPTIQGGLTHLIPLKEWADAKGVKIVLSSSFESPIGLSHIGAMAKRLSLKAPLGIGTLPYMGSIVFEK